MILDVFVILTVNGNNIIIFRYFQEPLCGKRMLKIELIVHNSIVGGHHTNIGDSATNNGYGE